MRKIVYILTISVFILSCKQKEKPTELKTEVPKENLEEENLVICKKQSENGIEFETCIKDLDFFILKNKNGEIVYRNENNPSEFIFTDFNEDGFSDIVLHFLTNVPAVSEILIFNSESKSFAEIDNFSNFPDSKKIKGTDFYYSYHRSGCADSNWDSDLFYFKGNIAVRIGNIHAIECKTEINDGIYFYKVNGEEKVQLKLIPIEKKDFEDKWQFIETYWTENYRKYK